MSTTGNLQRKVWRICIQILGCRGLSSIHYSDKSKHQPINPKTPKRDQLLISPYNMTPESNIKVTRIKEMINNLQSS